MKSDTLHTMDESLQYMDESLDTMEAVDGNAGIDKTITLTVPDDKEGERLDVY